MSPPTIFLKTSISGGKSSSPELDEDDEEDKSLGLRSGSVEFMVVIERGESDV